MNKQTSIQSALPLRKILTSRKKQRGSVIGLIIIVLLIIVGLIPIIMWLSHIVQEKRNGPPPDIFIEKDRFIDEFIDEPNEKATPGSLYLSGGAGFDNSDEGDIDSKDDALTESVPDTSQMTSDVSSEADTASTSGE